MSDSTQRELFPRAEPRMGDVERAAKRAGYRLLIGVDEAGRGPLAGPVHVGAVVFAQGFFEAEDETLWWRKLDDSKKLTDAKREKLFDLIREHALAYCIETAERKEIDQINILNATKRAMCDAVAAVCEALGEQGEFLDQVYIDGNQYIDIAHPQTAVIKGDARSYHIAAASILAKVARDRMMIEEHETWPEYGFDRHKGYGTKAHREAIALHGPCPLHRQSFAGVKEHLKKLRTEPSS